MKKIFLMKIRYHKQDDTGNVKTVTDQYLASAVSFTDAEAVAAEHLGELFEGGIAIAGISPFKMNEFLPGNGEGLHYKVNIERIFEETESGRVKIVKDLVVAVAESTREAEDLVLDLYKDSLVGFSITKVEKTKIVEFLNPETEE